jgi:hypothetical protein
MHKRLTLVVGLLGAVVVVPLLLRAVPDGGPGRGLQVGVWAFTIAALVLLAWLPLRSWAALPADERRASLRGSALAVPAAVAASVTLTALASALAVVMVLADPALAIRVGLASPWSFGSWSYTFVLAVPLVWALRRPTPTAVGAWCRHRGVPATANTLASSRRDLMSVRVWRTVGAVTGIAIGYGPRMANNRIVGLDDGLANAANTISGAGTALPGLFDPWTLGIAGYLLGALVAERRRHSARPAAQPVAGLDARRAIPYVSPLGRWLPPVMATVLALMATTVTVAGGPVGGSGTVRFGWAALIAIVLAVASVGLRRRIVSRPQRTSDAVGLVVDDAFRSCAVHAVAGASSAWMLAFVVLGLGDLLSATELSSSALGVGELVLFAVGLTLAMAVWLGLGSSYAWRVQRADPTVQGDHQPRRIDA